MKSFSNAYFKAMREEMSKLRKALNEVEKAENAQLTIENCIDYDKAKQEAKEASEEMMDSLKRLMSYASSIGCLNDAYEVVETL